MKILEVNSMPVGSTGTIMYTIGDYMRIRGHEVCYAVPEFDRKVKSQANTIIIGNKFYGVVAHVLGRITGYNDKFLRRSTCKFLKEVKEYNPDIIHLHNLHNCYLEYELLFQYAKQCNKCIIWTLHDCWAFTGGCVYFDLINCDRWKTGCKGCNLLNRYPKSYRDRTTYQYFRKKNIFEGMENMILVTPSYWLKENVEKSFLKKCTTRVIHNGIKTSGLKRHTKSKDYEKIMLLGVAFKWDERKGLNTFIELAKVIDDKYQIVLVGVEPKMQKNFPANIIAVPKTLNYEELENYYLQADIFINPTLEDNYPTTNLEAIVHGTPVITYNTGGSPESVSDDVGIVVNQNDINSLIEAIEKIVSNKKYYKENCLKKAKEFDMEIMCNKYNSIFEELYNKELERNE